MAPLKKPPEFEYWSNKTPEFDNLNDTSSKFLNTVCYYDKSPVYVKEVQQMVDEDGMHVPNKFRLSVSQTSGKSRYVFVDDPLFNYKEYNIGYANGDGASAAWWFRKPFKQYAQGLNCNQMSFKTTMPADRLGFGFKSPYISMLSNDYPSLEYVSKSLKVGNCLVMAFHKDFALSWDNIHNDFVLEYRGVKIGSSVHGRLDEYRLLPEFNYLAEALREALT